MLPGLVVIPGELGCIQALARDPRATRFVYRLTVVAAFWHLHPKMRPMRCGQVGQRFGMNRSFCGAIGR